MIEQWKITWKELLSKSVEQLPEDLTLSYSGGFDSSIILFSLLELGKKPRTCITFQVADYDSADLYYTRKACKTFEIPLQIVKIPVKTREELIEECRTAINMLNNSRQIDVQCATVFIRMFPSLQSENFVVGFFDNSLYKTGKKVSVNYSQMKRGIVTLEEHKQFYNQIRENHYFNKNQNHHVLMDLIRTNGFQPLAPLLNKELFDFSQEFSYQDFHLTEQGKLWIKYFLYQLWQPFFDKVGNSKNKNNMHVASHLKQYHEKVLLEGTNYRNTVKIYNQIRKGEL